MPWQLGPVIRCWPTFTKVTTPVTPPAAAPAPQTHITHHVGYVRRHHTHIWGLGKHKLATKLVFAGFSCTVVPGVLAGLAKAFGYSPFGGPVLVGAPVLVGGPGIVVNNGPTIVGSAPIFTGVPPGIIGQVPVTVAVPEPSSLWLLASFMTLAVLIYWSGAATSYLMFWFSRRRMRRFLEESNV